MCDSLGKDGVAYTPVPEADRVAWAKKAELRGVYTALWQDAEQDPATQERPLGPIVKERSAGAAVCRLLAIFGPSWRWMRGGLRQ